MIRTVVWIDALDEALDPIEEARMTLLLERLGRAGIDVARSLIANGAGLRKVEEFVKGSAD